MPGQKGWYVPQKIRSFRPRGRGDGSRAGDRARLRGSALRSRRGGRVTDVSVERCEAGRAALAANRIRVETDLIDIGDSASINAVADRLADGGRAADILVANAGIAHAGVRGRRALGCRLGADASASISAALSGPAGPSAGICWPRAGDRSSRIGSIPAPSSTGRTARCTTCGQGGRPSPDPLACCRVGDPRRAGELGRTDLYRHAASDFRQGGQADVRSNGWT